MPYSRALGKNNLTRSREIGEMCFEALVKSQVISEIGRVA
jgi:hypothetical protein